MRRRRKAPVPDGDRRGAHQFGALSGCHSPCRGVGTALGPLLAGVAIQALAGPRRTAQSYGAMWLVCSLAIVASTRSCVG